jgi:hypothetical protein
LDRKGIARIPSAIASLFIFLSPPLMLFVKEVIIVGIYLLLIGATIHIISLKIALVLLKKDC